MTTSATGPPTCSPALNVATGEVLYDCREHHTGKDVLQFFKLINLHVARNLDIHVVLDNLSAHMGPEVTDWLAHPKRGRWHLHFTPTSSSWLNIIERWFKELTDRRLRRGVFTSRGRPHRCHRDLGRTLEPRPRALHLAQDRRRDHHKSPPRTSRPPPDQIRDAPLVPFEDIDDRYEKGLRRLKSLRDTDEPTDTAALAAATLTLAQYLPAERREQPSTLCRLATSPGLSHWKLDKKTWVPFPYVKSPKRNRTSIRFPRCAEGEGLGNRPLTSKSSGARSRRAHLTASDRGAPSSIERTESQSHALLG